MIQPTHFIEVVKKGSRPLCRNLIVCHTDYLLYALYITTISSELKTVAIFKIYAKNV